MKKNFLAMMLGAVTALGFFSSCEDGDVVRGKVLSGNWRGDFGMYYYDKYDNRWDSYDTYIEFIPDNDAALTGYGYQTDFYDRGPYTKTYHAFSWEVRNSIIYLTYRSDYNLDTWIRDYDMTNSYFSGYFGNSSSKFSLSKLNDYFSWTPYINTYGDYNSGYGYGYYEREGYRYDSYLAPTRNEADSATEGNMSDGPVIVRFGNRFTD